MEKTIVLAKSLQQNRDPQLIRKGQCLNCQRLQTRLNDLKLLLTHREQQLENVLSTNENQCIKQVQNQLLELKQKYQLLKKKVRQIEKQNDELFNENTTLEKQISAMKIKQNILSKPNNDCLSETLQNKNSLKRESNRDEKNCTQQTTNLTKNSFKEQDTNTYAFTKEIKVKQLELHIERTKVQKMQELISKQIDEIAKLKSFLKKRNSIQTKRHTILLNLQQVLS